MNVLMGRSERAFFSVMVRLVVGRKVKNWKVKGVKMESRGKLSNDEK